MVAALVLASGAALAANAVCKDGVVTCQGTSGSDLLIGTSSGESLQGLGGGDHIIGNAGDDILNGGTGSDTYTFTNGFGADRLNDTGPATEIDAVDFSKVVPGGNGMRIRVIPEWEAVTGIPEYNSAFFLDNSANPRVDFGSNTTIERTSGSAGKDVMEGGSQNNTYDLRAGGLDSAYDFGGCTSSCLVASKPLPASNDTYTGYKSGFLEIIDYGGSGDVLDLRPRKSTDVSFYKKLEENSLEMPVGPSDRISVLGYFAGLKIEQIVFADRTMTGVPICKNPCDGTTGNDLLIGKDTNTSIETINGRAGNDRIIGNRGPDALNGAAGSDNYAFTSGFGMDTLNDTGPATETDTVDFSKIPASGGIEVRSIPGSGPADNRALYDANNIVSFAGSTAIEKFIGSPFGDTIIGGDQTNTYDLRAGGGTLADPDNVEDAGSTSNDTYTNYKSGRVRIADSGGSQDVLDLKPRKTTEVSFKKDGDNLDLITGATTNNVITLVNYFSTASTTNKIDTIAFSDRTLSRADVLSALCPAGGFCGGTSGDDLLIGSDSGGEIMSPSGGNDQIIGNAGDDILNGGVGSDTYTFTDGFGPGDSLEDTAGSASNIDTVDFSKVSAGMNIFAIPEYASVDPLFMQATSGTNKVTFANGTTIERIAGSAGNDTIQGGTQANTYDLRSGGNDTVMDKGGAPERPNVPALSPSDDTYTGYKSGPLTITDDGGSGDVLDLKPRKSTDVSFERDVNNLRLITGPAPDDVIEIAGYFTTSRKIEQIVFANRTITGISLKQ